MLWSSQSIWVRQTKQKKSRNKWPLKNWQRCGTIMNQSVIQPHLQIQKKVIKYNSFFPCRGINLVKDLIITQNHSFLKYFSKQYPWYLNDAFKTFETNVLFKYNFSKLKQPFPKTNIKKACCEVLCNPQVEQLAMERLSSCDRKRKLVPS